MSIKVIVISFGVSLSSLFVAGSQNTWKYQNGTNNRR
jgi:hypothetical protein